MANPLALMRSTVAFGLGPAVALVTAPILARVLGPEGRGQLAAITQPLTVADAIAAFGLPTATSYFIARGYGARSVVRIAYLLAALTSAATYLGLWWYSASVTQSQSLSREAVLVVWTAVIAGALLSIRRAEWAAHQAWARLDSERMLGAAGRLVLVVLLALIGVGGSLPFAAGPIAAGVLISAVVLFAGRAPRGSSSLERGIGARHFVAFASSASVGSVAYALNSRLDQVLLPVFSSPEQLGYYSVAVSVSEVPLVIGLVIGRNLLSEAASGVRMRELSKTLLMGLAAAAGASVAIALAAPWFVPLLFGEGFQRSIFLTQVLSISSFAGVCAAGVAAILSGRGYPMASSIGYIAPIAILIVLFGLLRSRVTVEQVAAASAVGQMVGVALLGLIALRLRTSRRRDVRA